MASRKRFSRSPGYPRRRRSSVPALENLEPRLVLSLGNPTVPIPPDAANLLAAVSDPNAAHKLIASPTSATSPQSWSFTTPYGECDHLGRSARVGASPPVAGTPKLNFVLAKPPRPPLRWDH